MSEETMRKPTNYYELGELKVKENKNIKISSQLNVIVECSKKSKKDIEIQTQEESALFRPGENQEEKEKEN